MSNSDSDSGSGSDSGSETEPVPKVQDDSSADSDTEDPLNGVKDADTSPVVNKKRAASLDNAEINNGEDGEYTDETLQCRDCEGDFQFTAAEQAFHVEKGFDNKPVRCKDCRTAKKARMNDESSYGGGSGASGGRACYNCGGSGHMSRECTEPRKEGGGGQDRACYNCGQTGHVSRDCTNEKKEGAGPSAGAGGDRGCYNCGGSGHISRDCSEPRKEGRGGGGRGGRGRGRGGGRGGGRGRGRGRGR